MVQLSRNRNKVEVHLSLGNRGLWRSCVTCPDAAVSAHLAHGWPRAAVAAAAATGRGAGGAVTVTLQEVLGLRRVEQGVNGDQLTGQLTGDVGFGRGHGLGARPALDERTGWKKLRVGLLLL